LTQDELNFCYNIGRPALFNNCDIRVEIGRVESEGLKFLCGYVTEKDMKEGVVICIVTIIDAGT
jgi:hypothetical protein